MLHPPLYKAEEVFSDNNLHRKVECICGRRVCLQGKDVMWTHRVNNPEYGWFCVCTFGCFLIHVSKGNA